MCCSILKEVKRHKNVHLFFTGSPTLYAVQVKTGRSLSALIFTAVATIKSISQL